MTHSIPLVFFGSDGFASIALEGLVNTGYDLKLVVTAPLNNAGGRNQQSHPVLELAQQHKLAIFTPDKLDSSAVAKIQAAGSDYAVLASYGKLLPESVLNLFKTIINVHPSLLPQWRGPSPIEAAILQGAEKTGVSLMKLVKAMDAGPIYAQVEFDLDGQETQSQLTKSLAESGRDLLLEKLPVIASGQLTPTPQDDAMASYCQLIKKSDGKLDWSKPATDLARQIRAYSGWPRSYAKLFDRDVIITKAIVDDDKVQPGQTKVEEGRLIVGCQQDSLEIERLQPAGRSEMSSAEFLRGIQS